MISECETMKLFVIFSKIVVEQSDFSLEFKIAAFLAFVLMDFTRAAILTTHVPKLIDLAFFGIF